MSCSKKEETCPLLRYDIDFPRVLEESCDSSAILCACVKVRCARSIFVDAGGMFVGALLTAVFVVRVEVKTVNDHFGSRIEPPKGEVECTSFSIFIEKI